MKKLIVLFAVLAVVVTAGCGGGSSVVPPPPNPLVGAWDNETTYYILRIQLNDDGTFVRGKVYPNGSWDAISQWGTWWTDGIAFSATCIDDPSLPCARGVITYALDGDLLQLRRSDIGCHKHFTRDSRLH